MSKILFSTPLLWISVLVAPPSGHATTRSPEVGAKLLINPSVTDLAWFPSRRRKSVRHSWYSGLTGASERETHWNKYGLHWTALISAAVKLKQVLPIYFWSSDWRLTLPPCWRTPRYHLLSLVPCNYRRDHPLTWGWEKEAKQKWKSWKCSV